MSALKTIAELEYSRHRFWSPEKSPRVYFGVFIALVLVGVVFGLWYHSVLALTIGAVYFISYGSFGLAMGTVMTLAGSEKMWFLGYPHSRRTLLMGKWIAACKIVVRGLFTTWGAYIVATAILLVATHGDFSITMRDVSEIVAWFSMSICTVFTVTVIAALSPLFQIGWWRLAWFFAWILLCAGGVPLGVMSSYNGSSFGQKVALIDAIIVLFGVILFALFYRYGSVILRKVGGMTSANRQYGRPDRVTHAAQRNARVRRSDKIQQMRVSPFFAIFWLEYSRYRLFSRDTSSVIRVIVGLVLLAAAVLSALAFRLSNQIAGPVAGFFDITTLFGLIGYFATIMRTMNDGYNKWFVAFPISRRHILLARVMAFYLVFLTMVGALLGAFVIGLLVIQVTHPYGATIWFAGLSTAWHAALLSVLFSFLVYAILTVSPTLFAQAGFSTMLTLLVYIGGIQAWNFWFIEVLTNNNAISQYWLILAIIVVAGVPLSILCLRYAAQHLDRLTRTIGRNNKRTGCR